MNDIRCIKTAFLLIALIALVGCTSKQGTSETSTRAPLQNAREVKNQNAAAMVGALPKDKADARAVAAHVLTLLEAGDYAAVYNQASPVFRSIGEEALFAAKFRQAQQKVGLLKNPQEISFASPRNNTHVLVYRLENEGFKTEMRLTLSRSQDGKMELAGLNQHDEAKNK